MWRKRPKGLMRLLETNSFYANSAKRRGFRWDRAPVPVAMAFIGATLLGSLVYAWGYPALAPLQSVGACGIVTLPELLQLTPGTVAALVVAVALLAFTAIEFFSKRTAR